MGAACVALVAAFALGAGRTCLGCGIGGFGGADGAVGEIGANRKHGQGPPGASGAGAVAGAERHLASVVMHILSLLGG